jgi:phytoene synthase
VTVSARESFALCRRVARRRARHFYAAFLLTPPAKRNALCAVYAVLRALDDAADEPGESAAKVDALRGWRASIDAAAAGGVDGHPLLPALRETMDRFEIPARFFHLLLEGAEMDLGVVRYPTFGDLRGYCYRVASAVGLICLRILGVRDERATAAGEACGIAFQLTNILRDVGEDAARGRIYLPLEDLDRFECTEEQVLARRHDERFERLMKFEADRAREHYARALDLPRLVRFTGRATLLAMIGAYRRLLDKIERGGFRVFARPVRLSRAEKLGISARAAVLALFPVAARRTA